MQSFSWPIGFNMHLHQTQTSPLLRLLLLNSLLRAQLRSRGILQPISLHQTPLSLLGYPPLGIHHKARRKSSQLIQRRGKAGLLAPNKDWQDAKKWIQDRAGKPQTLGQFLSHPIVLFPYSVILPQVESVTGTLSSFIV
jgi:hypothetical protein